MVIAGVLQQILEDNIMLPQGSFKSFEVVPLEVRNVVSRCVMPDKAALPRLVDSRNFCEPATNAAGHYTHVHSFARSYVET